MKTHYNFDCPHCGANNQVHRARLGENIDCLKCDGIFRAPAPEAAGLDRSAGLAKRKSRAKFFGVGCIASFAGLIAVGAICLVAFVSCSVADAVPANQVSIDDYRVAERARPDGKLMTVVEMKLTNRSSERIREIRVEVEVLDMGGNRIESASGVFRVYDAETPMFPGESINRFVEVGASGLKPRGCNVVVRWASQKKAS